LVSSSVHSRVFAGPIVVLAPRIERCISCNRDSGAMKAHALHLAVSLVFSTTQACLPRQRV
jgi:hypothetical protein